MNGKKVREFMELAGQEVSSSFRTGSDKERALGAQLLLSEVLEYVIKGLGVVPCVGDTPINEPNCLTYQVARGDVDEQEMIDGLADVAYTMFWNAEAFGIPLPEAYELVCDNNLEKFVPLENWTDGANDIPEEKWHCEQNVEWPQEVVKVQVLRINEQHFAVGKDRDGKVRKPGHYKSVDLAPLMSGSASA